jgi:hypothetical protein
MIGILCCHIQSLLIMQRTTSHPIDPVQVELRLSRRRGLRVSEVVEVMHPSSAAFGERLQYAMPLVLHANV